MVFELTVTDTWSPALVFEMTINLEDVCADAMFLAGSKTEVADIDVILGADGKTITPFFELSNAACLPSMVINTRENVSDDFEAYDATLNNDYIESATTDSLVVGYPVFDEFTDL
jgi:hypothetical protein